MPAEATVEITGETLRLLPERAVFWPRTNTLLVADVHLGKAATFRSAAIPVPHGTTLGTLDRLSSALNRTEAKRLIVLGDLLHARRGRRAQLFEAVCAWRARHSGVELFLVRGNHDRGAGDPPTECGFRCVNEPLVERPFVLRHHPDGGEDYELAGHVHPAVKLVGAGQRVKLPCFAFGARAGLLPAFGEFTGSALVSPRVFPTIFVVADDDVIPVA